eukprot:scaffold100258_cov57-Attheya_sp.AAC.1
MLTSKTIAMEEDGTKALLPRNSAIAISFFLLYGESHNGAQKLMDGIFTELNVRYGIYYEKRTNCSTEMPNSSISSSSMERASIVNQLDLND